MLNISAEEKIDFMKKAAFISNNSSCGYKVGAVGVVEAKRTTNMPHEGVTDIYIVRDMLLIKSWNITLRGEIYCQKKDSNGKRICIRVTENLKGKDIQKVCSSHAEISIIAKCARYGISTEGMCLFVTNSPCIICARAIYQAGIVKVIYMDEHTDLDGIKFLKKSKIELEKLPKEIVFKDS